MRTGFDLFSWLDADAAADLRSRLHRRSFSSGQSVYVRKDPGDYMYRVADGFVRLSVLRRDGRQAVFLLFCPGDFFGASTLVDDETRPQTAEVITPTQLDLLTRVDFDEMCARHASFNRAVMRLLSCQMRVASEYLVSSQLDSIKSRVAGRLVEIASIIDSPPGTDRPSPLRVTQSELAEMVGASRQSVNKILQQFQSATFIRLLGHRIVVEDPSGLATLSKQ